VVWLISTAALLLPLGQAQNALLIVSLGAAMLLILLGLLRTVRGPRAEHPSVVE
jgi:hypothetical protein